VPQTIAHISFSGAGGAGTVAQILSEEQTRQGSHSRVHSVISSDLRKAPLAAPLHTLAAGTDEYVLKARQFFAPISVLRDSIPGISSAKIQDADVIHLHGINGALNLNQILKSAANARVVWTLHDMNPFTGACHYSLGCEGFTSYCSQCPAVKGLFRNSVEARLRLKLRALSIMQELSVIAPSQWLAEQAAKSTVFREHPIAVIPNPIASVFCDRNWPDTPKESGNSFQAIVVAKNLSDPVKRVGLAVRAFTQLARGNPDARLLLVGAGGHEFRGEGIVLTGSLTPAELATEFSRSEVLIVPSRAENAPLVIPEAAARGCTPLVADAGGMKAMAEALGVSTTFGNYDELVALLKHERAVTIPARKLQKKNLIMRARKLHSPESAVTQYDKVYSGKF